ncbi:unnamed protein product [Caenorhabditis bovis]|uniref:Serpentine Receptor, class H n=1 Tax=Caenorhabditis bovis TaxID=2654633 RepID=A0A8S1ECP3_9PELO|nr:unnamed protein product [Caenorhabditis bovis]
MHEPMTPTTCLQEAPEPFRSLMHFLHILTVPLYLVSIFSLIFKSPRTLKDYKNYLLWHTLGNVGFEVYVSVFMLPMTYLPYPIFRITGILMYFDVNGLLIFYVLVYCFVHTGASILEMFRYRFNAAITEQTYTKYILRRLFWIFYALVFALPSLGLGTLKRCIPLQNTYKKRLYDRIFQSTIESPIELLCSTTVIAPPLLDPVFTPTLIMIIGLILSGGGIVLITVGGILKRLNDMRQHLSSKTLNMQRMLFLSLVVQGLIHAVMLGIPLIAFIYGIVFTLHNDDAASMLILLLSFHGSLSTIAMLIFTKPIREGVASIFRPILVKFLQTESVPRSAFTITEISLTRSMIRKSF